MTQSGSFAPKAETVTITGSASKSFTFKSKIPTIGSKFFTITFASCVDVFQFLLLCTVKLTLEHPNSSNLLRNDCELYIFAPCLQEYDKPVFSHVTSRLSDAENV
jgi:hypothetical protein